jgi:hypothetical protein
LYFLVSNFPDDFQVVNFRVLQVLEGWQFGHHDEIGGENANQLPFVGDEDFLVGRDVVREVWFLVR